MENLTWRTGKTTLSSDELLLFDVMFDCGCPLWALRQSRFAEQFNYAQSHQMSDADLQSALDRFVALKWLERYELRHGDEDDTYFGFTPEGGRIWELEREPVWSQYVSSNTHEDESNGGWIDQILSPNPATAQHYLTRSLACGQRSGDPGLVQTIRHTDYQLLPWKAFPEVYELLISNTDFDSDEFRPVDWTEYNLKRSWWRNAPELLSL